MIYLFAGDDTKKKRLSYEKFLQSVPIEAERFFISKNEFDETQFESLYSGAGLFSPSILVVFENIFEGAELRDFILKKLSLLSESTNTFVFLESKLGAPIVNAFKKLDPNQSQINIFELPKSKKEKYDNFLVANAFANRDKFYTWLYFRQAMDVGVGMEEIIGVLFWKIKDMLIKNDFRKFTKEELQKRASALSYLLPQAREQGRDAEAAFEQFILEAF